MDGTQLPWPAQKLTHFKQKGTSSTLADKIPIP